MEDKSKEKSFLEKIANKLDAKKIKSEYEKIKSESSKYVDLFYTNRGHLEPEANNLISQWEQEGQIEARKSVGYSLHDQAVTSVAKKYHEDDMKKLENILAENPDMGERDTQIFTNKYLNECAGKRNKDYNDR